MKGSIKYMAFVAALAGMVSCRMEEENGNYSDIGLSNYSYDLQNYSVYYTAAHMEKMIRIDQYLELSEDERKAEEWKDIRSDLRTDGKYFTFNEIFGEMKDGRSIFEEGAEWKLKMDRRNSIDYSSYLTDFFDEMDIVLQSDSTWSVKVVSEKTGRLINYKSEGVFCRSVRGSDRIWTVGISGSTSEPSGLGSEFTVSDGYMLTFGPGTYPEASIKGTLSVSFFKDGAKFDEVIIDNLD